MLAAGLWAFIVLPPGNGAETKAVTNFMGLLVGPHLGRGIWEARLARWGCPPVGRGASAMGGSHPWDGVYQMGCGGPHVGCRMGGAACGGLICVRVMSAHVCAPAFRMIREQWHRGFRCCIRLP